jgi:phage terminase small subunit
MTDHPLHIGFYENGTKFRLPLDLTTTTLAILAKKGRGKSYLAAVIAEELMLNEQIPVIIDPTGAHFGIKSSADGLKEGFHVVIFGGRHADLPLDEHNGEVIAQAIVQQRFPAIIDVSLLRKGAANRFLGAFFETLYRLNEEPLHIIADEADLYAPQRAFGDQMRTLGAVEDIVRRGRLRGLGCTLVTQRPQVLSKDVLTQAEMLVTLGMSHPKDISAIKEWVDVHATIEESKKMMDSLPTLPVGEAWFWAPGWGDLFEHINVRQRITFNSGKTPKAGGVNLTPKITAKIDLAALGEKLKVVADQARDNDPVKLRKEVIALREDNARLLAEKARADAYEQRIAELEGQAQCVDISVVQEMERDLHNVLRNLEAVPVRGSIPKTTGKITLAELPTPPAPISPELTGVHRNQTLTPVARKFLTVLIQRRPKPTERSQLAVLAGYSAKSGHVDNTLSASRTRGLITGNNDNLQITPEGVKILGKWTPLPRGAALVDYWVTHLNPAEGKMLRVLVEAYPKPLDRDTVAERAGYSTTSGHVDNSLGRLRTMDLIRGGNSAITASDDLF